LTLSISVIFLFVPGGLVN